MEISFITGSRGQHTIQGLTQANTLSRGYHSVTLYPGDNALKKIKVGAWSATETSMSNICW